MIKKFGFLSSVLVILMLPVAGYMVMRGINFIVPISEESQGYEIYNNALLLILLLIIPYLMLKFLFHALHIKNHSEPELRLRDLPKQAHARKVKKK